MTDRGGNTRTEAQIALAVLQFVRQVIAKGGTFYIKYPEQETLDVVTWDLSHIGRGGAS